VAEGFSTILGPKQVVHLPLESAPSRVIHWKPELVLVFGSCLPDECDYRELRYSCDQVGARLVFWLHDDPYEFDSHAKIMGIADLIFSNDRWASQHYPGNHVGHLPLGASPSGHTPSAEVEEDKKRWDLFFCGVGFQNRKRMLKDLSGILHRIAAGIYGDEWDVDEFSFCKNERIPVDRMKDYYAASRVVLNLGRDFHYANRKYELSPSTPGPRTFEAAMAGACQMIFADSLEVADYFDIRSEIVLFDGPSDFETKLSDLLNHPDKRTSIGTAARKRCLKDHTYAARAAVILERAEI
jgi:spore maturation protein CgeB